MSCLLDTNVLIHALAGNADAMILACIDDAIADNARYSVITRMELLGWSGHTEVSRRETEMLLAHMMEIALSPAVVSAVIDIRSAIAIKLPDAIIAASALVEQLPLMTRNTDDYKRISGLVLVDPFAA